MAQQFVVLDPATGLCERDPLPQELPVQWGTLAEAKDFGSLAAAQTRAADIGGGTVGTTKPR